MSVSHCKGLSNKMPLLLIQRCMRIIVNKIYELIKVKGDYTGIYPEQNSTDVSRCILFYIETGK